MTEYTAINGGEPTTWTTASVAISSTYQIPNSGTYEIVGGGGGGYYGGCTTSNPWAPTRSPFTTTTTPPFTPQGTGRLTAAQLELLLREHQFVALDNTDWCLFCYALDLYRSRVEHIFVIHEE